jgi:hypothetical protein
MPQLTPGFFVEWNKNLKPNPRIVIPCKFPKPKFLEFHAALAHKSLNPKQGLLLPTFLNLTENGQPSSSKTVWVNVPPLRVMQTNSGPAGNLTRAVLCTIRIPVAQYEVPDGKSVVALTLNFGGVSLVLGRIAFTAFRAVEQ